MIDAVMGGLFDEEKIVLSMLMFLIRLRIINLDRNIYLVLISKTFIDIAYMF